jgi:hypothetical protein
MNKYSLLWLLWLWPGFLLAQLNITSPQSRIVYQRNQANQATIQVAGVAPLNTTRIEARLVALPGYSGATTGWSSLNLISNNKAFRGTLTGAGGWYRLEVRAWADGNVAADGSIDRVGVGEVFVVAGQSNAWGVADAAGASDDRVSVVDFRDNDVNEQLLPVRFSHADAGGNVGPSNPLYVWGALGDLLVQRLQVPVLFLGAAQPGTTSEQWRKTAEGDMSFSNSLLPYRRLGSVLYHYIARTGARAVLWHQGEGDIGRGQQAYFDNINFLINKSRQQTGFGSLAWVVSRATYLLGQTDQSIINAQNQLISSVSNVFAGPTTDPFIGPDMRADNVHFSGNGLNLLINLWNGSLTDDFFNRSQPFSPSDTPNITTGYVLPSAVAPGSQIWVPYVQRGPFEGGNQFKAQLLNLGGGVVAESSLSTQNPIPLNLPGGLASGSYRVRVVSTLPNLTGAAGEPFQVSPGASGGSTNNQTQPAVAGGTPDASINRIGYRYDAPSHGFQFLVSASGPVDVRLERIDGGYFGETNWGGAGDNNEQAGFNKMRYYGPISVGVGGVEAGRYRLSVRKAGDPGAGIWVEINLLNGRTTVYDSSDGTQPTTTNTPVTQPTTPVEQPISPGFTPPTADYISQIGYKYDMPTHGFQLLGQAQGPVEMKLERLDGTFNETNWGRGTAGDGYTGYNYFRYYAPQSMGVGGVEPGRYRLSVRKTGDGGNGQSVEVTLQNGQFQAGGGSYNPVPTTPSIVSTPGTPVNGGSASGGQIRKIGYKYDMPTHGFELLTESSGNVEVRLERLDGAFGETNWGSIVVSSEYGGYNGFRRYSPQGLGIGGVEPGRYRLSARLVGDSGNGQFVDVTLDHGLFQVATPNARVATTASPEGVNWLVYPNPAESEVTVSGPSTQITENLNMVLTSLNGQQKPVTFQVQQPGRFRVNLGNAPTGVYLLRILDGNRPLDALKVVKVK